MKSGVSFLLTKDNQYICYLSANSSTLKYQISETYDIVIDLPGNTFKIIDSKRNSHSFTTWDDKDQAVSNRSNFDGIIIMLENNKNENSITLVLESWIRMN